MRRWIRSSSSILMALFSLNTAHAEGADIEFARRLFQEGAQLARDGAWEDASRRFAESARLKPHAVTTYNLAYCERVQGHLERARELFLESIAEHTARGGTELPPELFEVARTYVAELDLEMAGRVTPQPSAAAPPAQVQSPPVSPARAARSVRSEREYDTLRDLNAGAYAGAIVGLASLTAGIVTGAIVWSREDELERICPGNECSGEAAESLGSAKTLADVSTALFILGGTSLAVGVAVWLYTDAPPAPPEPQLLGVRPWVGLATVGCSGRF